MIWCSHKIGVIEMKIQRCLSGKIKEVKLEIKLTRKQKFWITIWLVMWIEISKQQICAWNLDFWKFTDLSIYVYGYMHLKFVFGSNLFVVFVPVKDLLIFLVGFFFLYSFWCSEPFFQCAKHPREKWALRWCFKKSRTPPRVSEIWSKEGTSSNMFW